MSLCLSNPPPLFWALLFSPPPFFWAVSRPFLGFSLPPPFFPFPSPPLLNVHRLAPPFLLLKCTASVAVAGPAGVPHNNCCTTVRSEAACNRWAAERVPAAELARPSLRSPVPRLSHRTKRKRTEGTIEHSADGVAADYFCYHPTAF